VDSCGSKLLCISRVPGFLLEAEGQVLGVGDGPLRCLLFINIPQLLDIIPALQISHLLMKGLNSLQNCQFYEIRDYICPDSSDEECHEILFT